MPVCAKCNNWATWVDDAAKFMREYIREAIEE